MHIHFSISPQDNIDQDTVIEISELVQQWIRDCFDDFGLRFDVIVSQMVDP